MARRPQANGRYAITDAEDHCRDFDPTLIIFGVKLWAAEVALQKRDLVTSSTVHCKLKNAIILAKQCAGCKKHDPTTVSRVMLDEAIKPLKAAGVLWPIGEMKLSLSRTIQNIGVATLSTPRTTFTTTCSKVTLLELRRTVASSTR